LGDFQHFIDFARFEEKQGSCRVLDFSLELHLNGFVLRYAASHCTLRGPGIDFHVDGVLKVKLPGDKILTSGGCYEYLTTGPINFYRRG
jgi:hypothetical protein